MKYLRNLLCIISMMLITPCLTAQTANVNLSSVRQEIRGFGGMNFPRWIPDLTNDQIDKAFGNGSGQIGLTILRVSVAPNSNDWSLEVPAAQRARSHGAIILGTPWSPPASMKTNNSTIQGELRTDAYDDYAAYLSDFANYMSSNGASLYAISVQNEPDWLPDYESCGWSYTQMYNFVRYYAGSIPTRVLAAEALGFNKAYTDPILNDAAAAANLDIVGGHLYGSSPSDYPLARNQGKEIWMTEHYTSSNVDANSWPDALGVGKEVNDCMINNFNAYIWWYIRRSYGMLDENGNVTKRGYVMSHFSKFVRPGFNRVDATVSPTSGVNISSYTDGNSVVIVAINQNSSSRTITYNFSGGAVNNITKYVTTSGSNVSNAGSVSGGSSMSDALSGYSIATYVGTLGEEQGGGTTSIWLEAECGEVGSLWNIVNDGSASNDQYVTIASGNNSTGSAPSNAAGYIDFDFSVSEGGNYSVWSRVITPNGTDDSFWVRMDGGSWFQWNNIGPNSNWAWEQAQTYNLNPGNHTLTIAYREDGALMDKLYITNTGSTPTGEGSGAENCNATCDPTPITPYISVNDGSWQQTSVVTINAGDQVELGPQPSTGGSWSWSGCGTSGTSREQTVFPTANCTATAIFTNSCGTQSSQDFTINVNSGGGSTTVWLEAECGNAGSLWNINADNTASNDQYVTIASGNNSTGSAPTSSNGHIDYDFEVSESGTYTLWARVIAPSPTDDSFWIRMDGGSWISWNNIAPGSTSWTWDDVQSYSLSAGSHTLTVAYREDGTRLDKLYLTNAGDTPSGEGSAASNCSGSGGDYTITVRALGTDGSENIELAVGGTPIGSWVLSTSMQNYNATTDLSGNITVEFTNDDGTVRDVQIDYISVNGSIWQAEDQSVNTGVWQDGSCGGSNSEWLHCGGYIGFAAFKRAISQPDHSNQLTGEISLYPNPAYETLYMRFSGNLPDRAKIEIYSTAGVKLMQHNVRENEQKIDLSTLPEGLYLLRLSHTEGSSMHHFYKL